MTSIHTEQVVHSENEDTTTLNDNLMEYNTTLLNVTAENASLQSAVKSTEEVKDTNNQNNLNKEDESGDARSSELKTVNDCAVLNNSDLNEKEEASFVNNENVGEADPNQSASSSLHSEKQLNHTTSNNFLPPSPPTASSSSPKPSLKSISTTSFKKTEKNSFYNVKWIEYNRKRLPIVTQNENGPCPLLAILNYLFLQHKISLSPSKSVVESSELTTLLANYILEHVISRIEPDLQENLEQQVNDAISMIPSLITGLDVNIRFTGISHFEYTSDIEIFYLLGIPLYHGWLVEPELVAVTEVIQDNSYNQLVVKIVHQRSSDNEQLQREALIAEEFLNSTASQLTYHGLCELSSALNNHDIGVFFRNNHFLTILKHSDSLYVLATDQGFLDEGGVVWETLSNIEGDSHFCDCSFRVFRPYTDSTDTDKTDSTLANSSEQINNDYLMALTLQKDESTEANQTVGMTDEELAHSLQLEEQMLRSKETAKVATKPATKTAIAAESAKQKKIKGETASVNQSTSTSAQAQSSSSNIFKGCVVM